MQEYANMHSTAELIINIVQLAIRQLVSPVILAGLPLARLVSTNVLLELFQRTESALVFSISKFFFSNNIACQTLDPNCVTCSSSSQCDSCFGVLLLHGPSCVSSCPPGNTIYSDGISCKRIQILF